MSRALSPIAWDGQQKSFNRKYRERRLAAVAKGQPFPSYQQAARQLGEAMAQAREHGDIAGINEFWDCVFRVPAKGSQAPTSAVPSRKASARLEAQARLGRSAEAAVRTSPSPTAVCGYVDPFCGAK